MKTIKLSNGVEMPLMGFGVYQITNDEECEKVVLEALKSGYRLIDTAAVYMNEEAVGRAIKKSGIPREEIFVTTKVFVESTNYEMAKESFAKSLKKLDLDYIDLFLIHQPFNDVFGAWKALEELYEAKKIRAIGVSNFYEDQITNLWMYSKIKPMVNQIEINPFFQRDEYVKYLQSEGVVVTSWASFAEGKNNIFTNEVIQKIGKKYNKSNAQVILRWLVQKNIAVIPKSVNKDRIEQNQDIWNFELSVEDMNLMKSLDTGVTQFMDHREIKILKMMNEIANNMLTIKK